MTAVLGATTYQTSGHLDNNIVFGTSTTYCGGCNGSFILDFTSTSIGSGNGVFGLGLAGLGWSRRKA
jgi:hypothetical protein